MMEEQIQQDSQEDGIKKTRERVEKSTRRNLERRGDDLRSQIANSLSPWRKQTDRTLQDTRKSLQNKTISSHLKARPSPGSGHCVSSEPRASAPVSFKLQNKHSIL